MCFTDDSHPPIAPSGAAVDTEDLTLTSKDGTKFAAMVARAATPGGAGIVILPDVRGLFHYYEELACRFAEAGITAVAFDYFGRTAGVAKRGEDFDWMTQVRQTKADQISDDVGACIAYIKGAGGGNVRSVFTLGFCFGGSNSWLQAANGHGLAGAVGFYGRPGPSFADQSPGPLQRVAELQAPILALMGGADQGIPQEQVDEFQAALKAAGKDAEVVVYPGAPHSFFDRLYEEHAAASADAWQRVLAFVKAHS